MILHLSQELKKSMGNVEGQTQRVLQLVNDILDLPKRSAGRLPSSPMEWQGVLNKFAQFNKTESKAAVLVMDDDPAILELMEYMLSREGYTVETACDGQAGLEKLKAHKPDFLILDLMMPELNGFEVLEAITRDPSLKDLSIVILTARFLTDEEKIGLQKRVQGIVNKGETDVHDVVNILNEHSFAFRSLAAA